MNERMVKVMMERYDQTCFLFTLLSLFIWNEVFEMVIIVQKF